MSPQKGIVLSHSWLGVPSGKEKFPVNGCKNTKAKGYASYISPYPMIRSPLYPGVVRPLIFKSIPICLSIFVIPPVDIQFLYPHNIHEKL